MPRHPLSRKSNWIGGFIAVRERESVGSQPNHLVRIFKERGGSNYAPLVCGPRSLMVSADPKGLLTIASLVVVACLALYLSEDRFPVQLQLDLFVDQANRVICHPVQGYMYIAHTASRSWTAHQSRN